MYTRTLALLQSIHVWCVLAMLQVVGWAIYAIAVLDGYIRSVLVMIEYLTALFNDSVTSCRIPAIWKSIYRPISLLCPAAKVMEALILTTVNTHLLPASDQHGFRTGHATTSALLQLTSDVATGFNQRKPPHRTVCVAVDLTAAFDTVNHNALLSKIARSTLPEATCRWLSNYIRGRQSVTSSRGVKSKARIIHTGVLQGSKLSPTLFSFYIADMPRPTEPADMLRGWYNRVGFWSWNLRTRA